MDQIRDRGNIKWTAMMLPEHRQLLQQLEESQDERECPELAEDKWEELQFVIQKAIEEKTEITLTFFQDKRMENLIGRIKKYDPLSRSLSLVGRSELRHIPVSTIVDAVPLSGNEPLE
ncbi:YolD-like family protein [Ammoniphilus sp. 3BR4]|uniref:YolD-like family protein n=1 Tax=Ammoniphilus sp. 3BR4 TaxID=3158265 RepID=UPI003466AAED